MRIRAQSYSIPIALACLAAALYAACVVEVERQDGTFAERAFQQTRPSEKLSGAAPVKVTKTAYQKILVAGKAGSDTVQLPVLPPVVPLPTMDAQTGTASSYVLTGIIVSDQQRSAIINGKVVHRGDHLDKTTTVHDIDASSVRIMHNGSPAVMKITQTTDVKAPILGQSK